MGPLPTLDTRALAPELMDDPALGEREHRRALAGLARLNRLANSAGLLWPHLLSLARRHGRRLRVLDLATGSGDIPIHLCARAARAGINLAIDGADLSDVCLAAARSRAQAAAHRDRCPSEFLRLDAVKDPLPDGYDVVMCSLFTHHLRPDQVVELLYKMRCAAREAVLVSDLERTRRGYGLALAASRLVTRSPIVHADALISVRAAFTQGEFMDLAEEAGLTGAQVRRHWPARIVLTWNRQT